MKTYQKEKPTSIQEMFDSIANRYDKANGVMSMSMHHRWNRQLVNLMLQKVKPKEYLDLCSGTGEIAFRLLKKMSAPVETFLLDFSPEMLACARQKAHHYSFDRHQLHYLNADAQEIPLPNESIDCATIAYGIRNVKDTGKCFRDVWRVLRKDGYFGILELTEPRNKALRFAHRLFLKGYIPLVGRFVTSNKEAYKYLSSSIKNFVPPQDLEDLLWESGFVEIKRQSLLAGIATIIIAKKG